jgi:hypothetical protein
MKRRKISPALNISVFLLILIFPSILLAQISFTYHTIDANFHGANSVHALDIDGNNLVDVLGAGLSANSTTLWKNDGGNPILWQKQTLSSNFAGA